MAEVTAEEGVAAVAALPELLGQLVEQPIPFGMGWLADWPDHRDYTIETDKVKDELAKAKVADVGPELAAALPTRHVGLLAWFPPIENQGTLGSCTAQAGVGLVEYFERKAFGKHTDASRLFLYKVTRRLLNWTGDTGAFIRTTMGAMRLFGVPPEAYWPYRIADFEVEPSAFCYAFAQSYQSLTYYRLDPPGTSRQALLDRIKTNVNAGLPAMFGFTVYDSIGEAGRAGTIPYPAPGDGVAGGHAVIACGYDDNLAIRNEPSGPTTTGALLVRNSWGTGWGDRGYGWLPYEYVLQGLAVDWWTLVKSEWIDTGRFGL
jgi:C1A family cysteine protease